MEIVSIASKKTKITFFALSLQVTNLTNSKFNKLFVTASFRMLPQ